MSDVVSCCNSRHVDSASSQCGGQSLFILGVYNSANYLRLYGESLQNGWRQQKVVAFCLVSNSSQSDNNIFLISQIFADDHIKGPHMLSTIRADPTKSNPKSGVVQMEWNLTGNLLLVRFGVFYEVLSPLYGFLSMFTR